MRRPSALVALSLLVAGTLTGATSPGTVVAANGSHALTISLTKVADGFSQPLLVTHAGDGSGRLFVVEKSGRVRIVKGSTVVGTPFLDLSGAISTDNERGLLGLAFHPSFETNGRFYVNFTNKAGDTAINEYRVSTDPDRADRASGRRILTIEQPYPTHNGGHIAFGPDGFLYIGTGDGGGSGDPGNRAQSLSSLHGKILRIDVNGTSSTRQYRIPSTNPYVGRTGLDEIWARGLRNPWRWSIDRSTRALWIGDVGQDRYEEVNRSTRGSYPVGGRGVNYGWRVMEGRVCYRPATDCSKTGKTLPLATYTHAAYGRCAITGGYVYRGSALPALVGRYLWGDFCSGEIWQISAGASAPASPAKVVHTPYMISSFGEDEAGELYLTDFAGGAVYRISCAST